MPVVSKTSHNAKWRCVADSTCKAFRVDFEYSLPGYDLPSGHLDMLRRRACSEQARDCMSGRRFVVVTTAAKVTTGVTCASATRAGCKRGLRLIHR